jgi:hypothetical protein
VRYDTIRYKSYSRVNMLTKSAMIALYNAARHAESMQSALLVLTSTLIVVEPVLL